MLKRRLLVVVLIFIIAVKHRYTHLKVLKTNIKLVNNTIEDNK